MNRFLLRILTVPLLGALVCAPSLAGRGRKSEPGRVDWQKGVLYATGLGAISNKEPNQAKAYLRARGFAKLDALRNLLMVVDHVKIDARTTGADFEAVNDEIKAEVKGIVRGAQVVSERRIPVGASMMVEVTVATPMYGDQGIASVFLPEVIRRSQEEAESRDTIRSLPPPVEPEQPEPAPPIVRRAPSLGPIPPAEPRIRRQDPPDRFEPRSERTPAGEPYTSLVIDARGLGVERCMSPKIRRQDGSELWGTVRVNLDWLIEHGIVAYALNLNEARRIDRAGDNPLVIRAVGRAGGKFNSDAVVTDRDAERILDANARGKFLDNYHVIFVVDSRL